MIYQDKVSNITHKNTLEDIERIMHEFPQAHCPMRSRFTPGLYIREVTLPAGSVVMSKKHKTEHPFVVLKGSLSVWTEDKGWVLIKAPFTGVTPAGTQRIAYVHEETIWTTFHATDKNTEEDVENEIIERSTI